jgi:hypothetical protein
MLVEHRDDLHLRRDQVVALQSIDTQHRATSDQLEAELDALDDAPRPAGGGGGARAGGRGGRRRGGGGPPPAQQPQQGSAPAAQQKQARAAELRARLAANDRDAIAAALQVLDGGQVDDARKLLVSAGFSVPEAGESR